MESCCFPRSVRLLGSNNCPALVRTTSMHCCTRLEQLCLPTHAVPFHPSTHLLLLFRCAVLPSSLWLLPTLPPRFSVLHHARYYSSHTFTSRTQWEHSSLPKSVIEMNLSIKWEGINFVPEKVSLIKRETLKVVFYYVSRRWHTARFYTASSSSSHTWYVLSGNKWFILYEPEIQSLKVSPPKCMTCCWRRPFMFLHSFNILLLTVLILEKYAKFNHILGI